MAIYSQEFKVQSVEKALSKRKDQTLNDIADDLHIGYSTLQRWITLAKKNTVMPVVTFFAIVLLLMLATPMW